VAQSSLSLASQLRQLSLAGTLMADKVIALPKRPATPWSTYYGNNFAKAKKANPGLKVPELMKLLSEEWKNVSNVEKDKMQTMYEKAKKVYAKRMASIPDYEVEAAKMKKAGIRADKGAVKDQKEAKKELKVLLEALNKPKKPLSSYLLFCQSEREKVSANISIKLLGENWSRADESVKARFQAMAQEESARYKEALCAWEERMHSAGYTRQIAELTKRARG